MKKEAIRNYLETIRSNEEYDSKFVDVLIKSYAEDEDGMTIAKKIIEIIDKRYDENKENKT